MAKPSMFSKDYDERMRKRKKTKRILTVIVILFLITGGVFFSSNIGKSIKTGIDKVNDKINDKINNKDTVENPQEKEKPISQPKEVKHQQKTKIENENKVNTNEKIQTMKLSNGEDIKIKYSMVENQRQYLEIAPNIQYSISPMKKKVVLLDKNNQRIIFVDEMGKVKDITKKEYVSSKGKAFTKESILKGNPEFIWNSLPKFINEDDIVYVSQLPWFNRVEDKFIWKYTISTNVHKQIIIEGKEINGKEIGYGKITGNGLEVIIDGNKNLVK